MRDLVSARRKERGKKAHNTALLEQQEPIRREGPNAQKERDGDNGGGNVAGGRAASADYGPREGSLSTSGSSGGKEELESREGLRNQVMALLDAGESRFDQGGSAKKEPNVTAQRVIPAQDPSHGKGLLSWTISGPGKRAGRIRSRLRRGRAGSSWAQLCLKIPSSRKGASQEREGGRILKGHLPSLREDMGGNTLRKAADPGGGRQLSLGRERRAKQI